MSTEDQVKDFTSRLYETANGRTHEIVDFRGIGLLLRWTEDETARILDYAIQQGYVQALTIGGGIGITSLGIDVSEEQLGKQSHETTSAAGLRFLSAMHRVVKGSTTEVANTDALGKW